MPSAFDLEKNKIASELTAIYREPDGSLPNMKTISVRKNHSVKSILVGILVVAVLGAGGVWVAEFLGLGTTAIPDALTISVEGAAQTTLGATTTITISYSNRSEARLENPTINAYAPAGFVFVTSSLPATNAGNNEWHLPTIPPYGRGELTITGLPFGNINSNASWRVFAHYQPEHFGSTLEAVGTLATSIAASPFTVNVNGPNDTVVGSPTTYVFKVDTGGAPAPGKLELVPDVPGNFVISSSSPKLVNNRWSVASLKASSSSLPSFSLTGSFTSANGSSTPVGAHLVISLGSNSYQVASTNASSTVSENAVMANLAINGSTANTDVEPGDTLTISVRAKNASLKDIKNVKLKLVVDAPSIKKASVLDWAAINDPLDGTILGEQVSDSIRRGTIVWTNAQLPALAHLKSTEDATVDIRLPIKSLDEFDADNLPTSTIQVTASFSYTDSNNQTQTVAAAPITLTMNSNLAFGTRRVEGKTKDNKQQFDITWVLTNSFHDLTNIVVTGNVLGDATVTTATSTAGTTQFSESDKLLTWQIASLPQSVDVATFPFKIVLKTNNPSQTALISKVHVSATDATTGHTLTFLVDEVPLTVTSTTSTP
jgi:hypothetical protein